ncbi:MAG: AbrB/MazE/SpoVT family DNA-binding domain-containing protein [Candidatus Omnitrophota bacterium]
MSGLDGEDMYISATTKMSSKGQIVIPEEIRKRYGFNPGEQFVGWSMDFEKVIELVVGDFKKEKINYAFMGGFAMGALGVVRATADLDFLIDSKDALKVEKIMRKYSYQCVYKTENIAQYVSDVRIFGEIDYLFAFRKISLSMLKKSTETPVLDGKIKVKVLRPEDIIGLKLQALVNDKSRENKEYSDIEKIAEQFNQKLDWEALMDYFELFKKEKEYKVLRKKYYGKIE